ncbi:RDD family protein [Jeotgalibacillus marinus]|uniref:RDD family protein n=1 Tax=Jeotgalibacillus marinus TaxID=86667 RepID=A0ABV3Q1D0_9BACL
MVRNPAGFWIRIGAHLIESIMFIALYFIFGIISFGFILGIFDVIGFLYPLLLPVLWGGYTIGKYACQIRIVKVNGENVTLWTMIKRHIFGTLIYGGPFLFALIISILILWGNIEEFNSWTFEGYIEQIDEQIGVDSDSALIALLLLFFGVLGSFAVALISAIMVGARKDKRSIHDLVAGTYVTYDPPGEPTEPTGPAPSMEYTETIQPSDKS